MEVTEKDYKIFYKTRRRQRYLKERAEEKMIFLLIRLPKKNTAAKL